MSSRSEKLGRFDPGAGGQVPLEVASSSCQMAAEGFRHGHGSSDGVEEPRVCRGRRGVRKLLKGGELPIQVERLRHTPRVQPSL